MNGRSIPGFYWELADVDDTEHKHTDPEKKKYFRIQANHVAPTGSQYSREAVKKRKLNDEIQKLQINTKRREQRELVQTPRCLSHSFTRLTAEVGNITMPGFVRKSQLGGTYVSQLHERTIRKFGSSSVVDFTRIPSGLIATGLITARGDDKYVFDDPISKNAESWRYQSQSDRSTFEDKGSGYRISSVSVCDSGCFAVTMDSSTEGEPIVKIGYLDHDNRPIHCPASWGRSETTFWCSAARPNSSSNTLFAIGSSDGLQAIRVFQYGSWERTSILTRSNDALAVEWLNDNVIASGFRDSFLFLSDLRSGGSSRRIKHPQSIGRIKKMDDYRLVVAGYKSLHMYDLRYPKTETTSTPTNNTPRNRHDMKQNTKPYLVVDNYTRELDHPFDLSSELGILVGATQDQTLCFYSLADGSVIPTPKSLLHTNNDNNNSQSTSYGGGGGSSGGGGKITQIQFEKYEFPMNQRQCPRFLYSQGSVIKEVTW